MPISLSQANAGRSNGNQRCGFVDLTDIREVSPDLLILFSGFDLNRCGDTSGFRWSQVRVTAGCGLFNVDDVPFSCASDGAIEAAKAEAIGVRDGRQPTTGSSCDGPQAATGSILARAVPE
jgi:hypothetical protein